MHITLQILKVQLLGCQDFHGAMQKIENKWKTKSLIIIIYSHFTEKLGKCLAEGTRGVLNFQNCCDDDATFNISYHIIKH